MGIGDTTKRATQSTKWSIGWTQPVKITEMSNQGQATLLTLLTPLPGGPHTLSSTLTKVQSAMHTLSE